MHALDGEATRFERIGIAKTVVYDQYDILLGFAPLSEFFEGCRKEENREFSLLQIYRTGGGQMACRSLDAAIATSDTEMLRQKSPCPCEAEHLGRPTIL